MPATLQPFTASGARYDDIERLVPSGHRLFSVLVRRSDQSYHRQIPVTTELEQTEAQRKISEQLGVSPERVILSQVFPTPSRTDLRYASGKCVGRMLTLFGSLPCNEGRSRRACMDTPD